MIDDREVWACASLLIEQHCEDAWFWAAQRADALLAEGNLDGQRAFLRVLDRIELLEKMTSSDRVH